MGAICLHPFQFPPIPRARSWVSLGLPWFSSAFGGGTFARLGNPLIPQATGEKPRPTKAGRGGGVKDPEMSASVNLKAT